MCRKAAGRGENGEESEPESKESERSSPDDEGGRARKQKLALTCQKCHLCTANAKESSHRAVPQL